MGIFSTGCVLWLLECEVVRHGGCDRTCGLPRGGTRVIRVITVLKCFNMFPLKS